MRMYCHTIFRGDGVNTQLTFSNAKFVLDTQINRIKRGRSEIYSFPNEQNKIYFEC